MDVAIRSSRSTPFQLTPRKRHLNRNPQISPLSASDILPDELWQIIGSKLSVADRLRFRAVCKTWMSLLPSRMPPWIMLREPEKEPPRSHFLPYPKPGPPPPRRNFMVLGEQTIYECDFPDLHRTRCLGSSGNWLATAHEDKSLRLLNPFDKRQIHLPSITLFDDDVVDYCGPHGKFDLALILVWKVVLNSSPSNWRDCIAMAIHNIPKRLAFARLGDHKWTTLEMVDPRAKHEHRIWFGKQSITYNGDVQVQDVIFYQDQFYGVTNYGELLACDLRGRPPMVSYLCGPVEDSRIILRRHYLVEWTGGLLMAKRFIDMPDDGTAYGTTKFEIYKFDFVQGKWDEMKSLGEYSLFLGLNTSACFCASDYFGLVRKNCVYFSDDFMPDALVLGATLNLRTPFGHDMGVFDLEDKCVTPYFKDASTATTFWDSLHLMSPPVWIVPPEKDSIFQDKYPKSDW